MAPTDRSRDVDSRTLEKQRREMVEQQLRRRGIEDERVLAAMGEVPRDQFVDPKMVEFAYEDSPLPIEAGQTISQPYIVALTLQALELKPSDRLLDVGTGSGYAAAVASRIVDEVFTIERQGALAETARERFVDLGYENIHVRHGDGTRGWPEHAPFDAIAVAAAGPEVPGPLKEQLAPGGRIVIPVGATRTMQELLRVRKAADGILEEESLGGVRFVPLIGVAGWEDPEADPASPTATVESPAPERPRDRLGTVSRAEPDVPSWTRRALVVAVIFLAIGLWMVLDALGISPPPLSGHWPLFLILGGLASAADFLAISRRPGALGLAVTGVGLGLVSYLLVLEVVQWSAPRLWIPGVLLTFGLALLATWGADPDRTPRKLVAGTILSALSVTFWSWVEIPMLLFWGLLLLGLGGVILYSVLRRRGSTAERSSGGRERNHSSSSPDS